MLEWLLFVTCVWALFCPGEFGAWLAKVDAGRRALLFPQEKHNER